MACAYAEESPLIVITGGPGKSEKRLGVQVHHEVKSYDSQFKIYQEVTEFGAVLDDPRTAAAQIPQGDRGGAEVQASGLSGSAARHGVRRHQRRSRASSRSSCASTRARSTKPRRRSSAGCSAAQNPVLIVGVEVHRFHLMPKVLRAGRAAADSGHLVVSRPRRVSDAASAVHRHLPRRVSARSRCAKSSSRPIACCCSASSSATRALACRPIASTKTTSSSAWRATCSSSITGSSTRRSTCWSIGC